MAKTIAVLFHENTKPFLLKKYTITYMARFWRERGHEVISLFGVDDSVEADICIVHVDLSVVPEHYLDFANRFPIVLNGNINNICKRSFSRNILEKKDRHTGEVIVKTDLNYGGWPEKVVSSGWTTLAALRLWHRLGLSHNSMLSNKDYRIYASIEQVPEMYFSNNQYVVEKFLPQKEDGQYCLNSYIFFGEIHQGLKHWSNDPVVVSATSVRRRSMEPHPEIIKIRRKLGLDFGKLDYAVRDGEVVLYDVNKTVGTVSGKITTAFLKSVRKRSYGVEAFL